MTDTSLPQVSFRNQFTPMIKIGDFSSKLETKKSPTSMTYHDGESTYHKMRKITLHTFETPLKTDKDTSSQKVHMSAEYTYSTGLTVKQIPTSRVEYRDNSYVAVARKLNFDNMDEECKVPCTIEEPKTREMQCHSPLSSNQKEGLGMSTARVATEPSPPRQTLKGKREVQCRYCSEQDTLEKLIRPCLCSGSMQYVHQNCLQKDIEENYMDECKVFFQKELKCQICNFNFVIKTFASYNFDQTLVPHQKFQFLGNLFIAVIAIVLFGVMVQTTVQNDNVKRNPTLIFLLVLGCLVCLATISFVSYRIIFQLQQFEWKVQDRVFHTQGQGEVTDPNTLSQLVRHFRQRHSERTVVPQ